jgi:hypothetical protein
MNELKWLGDLDSNQDWRSQSPLSFFVFVRKFRRMLHLCRTHANRSSITCFPWARITFRASSRVADFPGALNVWSSTM